MDMILKLIFIFAISQMALGNDRLRKPTFGGFKADFSKSLLTINLKPPGNANGHNIFYYYISISWGNGPHDCVYWTYFCMSCYSNKVPGKNGNVQEPCLGNKVTDIRDGNMNNIQVDFTNKSIVRPYKNYTLKAQGRNMWGYGEILIVNFTAEYRSGPPKIGDLIFLEDKHIGISFGSPVPSGKISEYIVIMKTLNKSLCFKWAVTCIDCTTMNVQTIKPEINYDDCQNTSSDVASFKSKSTNITVRTRNKLFVVPNTKYSIEIQARNGWGWGNISQETRTTKLNDNSKKQSVLDDMDTYKYLVVLGISVFILIILIIFLTILNLKKNTCKPAPKPKVVVPTHLDFDRPGDNSSASSLSIPRPNRPINLDNFTDRSISNNSSSMVRPSRPTTGPHLIANNNSSMTRSIPHTSYMTRQTKFISRNNSATQMMPTKRKYNMQPLKPNNRDNSAFHSIKKNEPDCKVYDLCNLEDAENFYTNSAPIVPPRLNAPANIEPIHEESYEPIYGAGKVPRHNNKSAFSVVQKTNNGIN